MHDEIAGLLAAIRGDIAELGKAPSASTRTILAGLEEVLEEIVEAFERVRR